MRLQTGWLERHHELMDFYFGKNSGNSARSAFALYEAGVAFTPHALDVPGGASRASEYASLNPLGKVPALLEGATALWESNAINWYIAEAHPRAALLPATPAGRASVQRWLFFQAAHVSPAATAVNRELSPRHRSYWKLQPDPRAAEAGQQELARYLPVLDGALAGSGWLEPEFSLADIAYTPHLAYLLEGGFDFSTTPRVREWLERLLARPAWQQARALVFDYY
jgi:glutathione S-transferase